MEGSSHKGGIFDRQFYIKFNGENFGKNFSSFILFYTIMKLKYSGPVCSISKILMDLI